MTLPNDPKTAAAVARLQELLKAKRESSPNLGVIAGLAHAQGDRTGVRLGIRDRGDGARVVLAMGAMGNSFELAFTADEAEQLAVDLRTFALELRNGGPGGPT